MRIALPWQAATFSAIQHNSNEEKSQMSNQQHKLSPAGIEALTTVRALRRMAQTSATIAAEKRVTKQLSVTDITAIALILSEEDEEVSQ
jgi:hypothetical protein